MLSIKNKATSSTVFQVFSITGPCTEIKSPRLLANTLPTKPIYIHIYIYCLYKFSKRSRNFVFYDLINVFSIFRVGFFVSVSNSSGVLSLRCYLLKMFDILVLLFFFVFFFVFFFACLFLILRHSKHAEHLKQNKLLVY